MWSGRLRMLCGETGRRRSRCGRDPHGCFVRAIGRAGVISWAVSDFLMLVVEDVGGGLAMSVERIVSVGGDGG